MTAQIRLLVLVLVLAYSMAFGAGLAQSAAAKRSQEHRLRVSRPRLRTVRLRQAPSPIGLRAVRFARRLVGVPYRWGGDSPATGFDCSGFVRFVYGRFGITLPHSSYGDFDLGTRVSRRSLRPGDLVFFDGVGHVGMYIGHGRFIHAPHSGTDVQVTSMGDPWYRTRYDGARRLLPVRAAMVFAPRKLPLPRIGLDSAWARVSYGKLRRSVSRLSPVAARSG